ncbi:MAG: hypothetical protein EA376_02435 [Phycisphaeraceae bacterium]|nr:MAG: hypothetical protein EA376_02435 [Phycisphaeraceae bacterium]
MNEMLSWLLDLNMLDLGAENVRFGFERPLPLWGWFLVVQAAVALAAWSYWRLSGSRFMRGALAGVRAALLLLLVALICGPQLVQSDETVERDWVVALVDRSLSMTIEDVDIGNGRISREEQLRRSLQRSWPTWESLAEQRRVVWLGFDAGAYDLPVDMDEQTGEGMTLRLDEPQGRRTNIGAAMDQALRRAAARPLSGVVIFSDGKSLDEPSRAAMRRLRAERIPVHVVPLGSEIPVGDLAIRRAEGPGMAFVDDTAPVTVEIERVGAPEGLGGTLRLLDKATGRVLDERPIDPDEETQTITLTHRPEEPGDATWVVEILPDGPDLIAGNNRAEVPIELIDRPLRILYVDGYPRWEQRFLRNLFLREGSILSSNLLLAPNRRPSQEGDVEIDALPDSSGAWGQYDLVVIGDASPEVFSRKQLEDLREHVSVRGGGLLWIGGEGLTPEAWWGTPLADLLPFTRDGLRSGGATTPSIVRPTALAERFGVMRLSDSPEEPWPAELSSPDTGWSMLRWRQPIDPAGLKPTAEVLALATPAHAWGRPDSADATPLVMSMRYGAGRIIYVGTDEIWRWRYGRGEVYFERFWLQLVRLLGRESLARTGRDAALTIEPRRAVVEPTGAGVRIAIELLDQSLVEIGLSSIMVRLERRRLPGEAEDPAPVELTLRPEDRAGRLFSGTWIPTEPGEWQVRAAESALAGYGLEERITVSLPDDELRSPETDHALLARLAEDSGGKVFDPGDLSQLPAELPNRRVRLLSETAESLWDTPLALILVVMLLTMEWVGRRLVRLV